MQAIEASQLRKTYPPSIVALDGLSLTVPTGTIFGLLGPNGAGKSTTVRVLSTLTRPDSGTARVAGVDVLTDPVAVRRAIGVVGQKQGADREATARENLVLQGEFHGLTGRLLRERIARSLQRMSLTDAADRLVKTYSGGMARRLDIAMGLIHEPRVLFLDEPTAGLDPEGRTELWREVERLTVEEELTVLLTTHYMEEADRLASRLAIVDRGRIVVEGTPDALKAELHGDTLAIELESAQAGRAHVVLSAITGLDELVVEGRTVHARARDGGAALPSVLAALEADGLRAAAVTISRPTLEDVYLRHAGRTLQGAGSGAILAGAVEHRSRA